MIFATTNFHGYNLYTRSSALLRVAAATTAATAAAETVATATVAAVAAATAAAAAATSAVAHCTRCCDGVARCYQNALICYVLRRGSITNGCAVSVPQHTSRQSKKKSCIS